jgi:uncharacterized membrane protein YhaH (DUF805 family)
MSIDVRFFRPIGVLAILASDPMIEAGAMAAGSFLQEGDQFRLVISVVSVLAAVLLLVAGILLCFKRVAGRNLAYAAAALSVPISLFAAAIGLMGSHALMYGVGYPIVIVLLLKRATPSNGLPTIGEDPKPVGDAPPGDVRLRMAIA